MLEIDKSLKYSDLTEQIDHLWNLSGEKILSIENNYDHTKGAQFSHLLVNILPEVGQNGLRVEYGSAALQFEATKDEQFLEIAKNTLEKMAPHVTHFGVHDHGFNNVSTYGNLLRMLRNSDFSGNEWETNFYELALKLSGASQARRWTEIDENNGFVTIQWTSLFC